MDIYRQTSKHLRIVITHGILQHMSKDMDENHKTMLGVLLHLRNQEAYNNLNFDRDDERYNRSHDQLYVFNELFGEENPKLSFKASPGEGINQFRVESRLFKKHIIHRFHRDEEWYDKAIRRYKRTLHE